MIKKLLLPIAILLGIMNGYFQNPFLISIASASSDLFMNLLKLVSLPIIFLSIVSTASGMDNIYEIKNLGKKVAKYTILTTLAAATIALSLFILINPVQNGLSSNIPAPELAKGSYLTYLLNAIPSNFIQPFVENNVISVLFLALLFSMAILSLSEENRLLLNNFFKSLYAAVMKITSWIVQLMPIAIWAFMSLFIKDLNDGLQASHLAKYLIVVVGANLVQALIVLPLLLKIKGIPPIKTFKSMIPALSIAFFSKSSSGALPMAMKCAEEKLKISSKVARFSLPLCTTINMNACAGFILTTVLFVSMSQGIQFSSLEMFMWIFVATIAAIGNAGVPMGCYFLTSAFLASMNVPLNLLAVILPFYTMIDMLESAINVWSDSCVTAIVDKEVQESVAYPEAIFEMQS